MRQLLLLLVFVPLSATCQETRTSLGVNMFYGYSGNRYLNNINMDLVNQYERGIDVWRMNGFFEYALSEKRKSHIIWGFGFDHSGHSNTEPVDFISNRTYRQYYLYLPISFKYKWTDNFYASIGMAEGTLIESRYVEQNTIGTYRSNDVSFYREFQLSSTLNLGYEIPLNKNRVLFFQVAGNYNWLGKITDDAAEDQTQRAAWQGGLGIGIMKRF